MDAPPIQYCRTEDGVNIAFWRVGEGPAIVLSTYMVSGASAWEIPQFQSFYERLSAGREPIAFDGRGTGMSDRMPEDISLRARGRDLEAVVKALQIEQHDLVGDFHGSPPSIAYAVTHPERVTRLVLWQPYARHADYAAIHGLIGLRQIYETAMDTWAMALAQRLAGWAAGEAARPLASLIEGAFDKEYMDRFFEAIQEIDLSDQLGRIVAPTLVMHRRDGHFASAASSRFVASGIPTARLSVLAGDASVMAFGDQAEVVNLIRDFLDEGLVADEPQLDSSGSPFRTLLFTDLESSTALTQALGDAKAQEVLHGHNDAVRAALAAHDGGEVKHTGDGIMAAFGSAVSAVEAALQIQRELAGAEVRVRVGLNAGEPIAEEGDFFGTMVQLASRVCDRAEPGQVLVSNVVRELCTGKGFTFVDQGETTLKGFGEPVRLFAVGEGA